LDIDAVWCDPARRRRGRNDASGPESWSPPRSRALASERAVTGAGIKLATRHRASIHSPPRCGSRCLMRRGLRARWPGSDTIARVHRTATVLDADASAAVPLSGKPDTYASHSVYPRLPLRPGTECGTAALSTHSPHDARVHGSSTGDRQYLSLGRGQHGGPRSTRRARASTYAFARATHPRAASRSRGSSVDVVRRGSTTVDTNQLERMLKRAH